MPTELYFVDHAIVSYESATMHVVIDPSYGGWYVGNDLLAAEDAWKDGSIASGVMGLRVKPEQKGYVAAGGGMWVITRDYFRISIA